MTPASQIRQPVALFDHLDCIEPRVAAAEHIALFLDFDGTISPIVLNPKDAEVDPQIYSTLQALAARPDFTLAIVSGRALADIRKRVPLTGAIYVGNHGLQIESDDICFREPEAERLRRELKCLSLQLKLALSDTEGVEIEDKDLTIAVHFRRVAEEFHDWLRNSTYSTVGRSKSFTCREGKMVLDIQPQIAWNKGRAVRWITREVLQQPSLPIYIGDDVTDEDAFASITEGITIRVGGLAETEAQFLLPDVPGVGQFLTWLDHAKPHASLANIQRVGR
jgi:trehalose 6-phosphate phosphatase